MLKIVHAGFTWLKKSSSTKGDASVPTLLHTAPAPTRLGTLLPDFGGAESHGGLLLFRRIMIHCFDANGQMRELALAGYIWEPDSR